MITIDILRRAQGDILNLQAYINQLEPKATAFDLLVRTHLGRTLSPSSHNAVNELEAAISDLQDAAAREAAAVAAKAAEKAAKAKKPRKPRTPMQTASEASGGQPAEQTATEGGTAEGSQATTSDPNAPTPIDSGRRRRGIFGGAPAAAE